MASFKKAGQTRIVERNQYWKSWQTGKIGQIVNKGNRHREWIMNIGRKSHHITEGTLLKYFNLVS